MPLLVRTVAVCKVIGHLSLCHLLAKLPVQTLVTAQEARPGVISFLKFYLGKMSTQSPWNYFHPIITSVLLASSHSGGWIRLEFLFFIACGWYDSETANKLRQFSKQG